MRPYVPLREALDESKPADRGDPRLALFLVDRGRADSRLVSEAYRLPKLSDRRMGSAAPGPLFFRLRLSLKALRRSRRALPGGQRSS